MNSSSLRVSSVSQSPEMGYGMRALERRISGVLMQMRITSTWASGRCAERFSGAITAGVTTGLAGQQPSEQRSAMTTRGLNRGEIMANFANGNTYCGSEIDRGFPCVASQSNNSVDFVNTCGRQHRIVLPQTALVVRGNMFSLPFRVPRAPKEGQGDPGGYTSRKKSPWAKRLFTG